MTSKPLSFPSTITAGTTPKPRFLEAFARRALLSRLSRITKGEIILCDGSTHLRFGRVTAQCPLRVTVTVTNPRFYTDTAFGGSIGAGEAFMAGYWQVDDLSVLIRIFLCNRKLLDGMDGRWAWLTMPIQKFLHRLNRNTAKGSRRNISAHYDVGNDFFALFLDESLMYSSAIFTDSTMTLHEAQMARLDHICRKLELKSTDHLLEIGSGWGGFALHAATRYGCQVTTTTISQQQYDLACERVAAAGLDDRITVLCTDYRDLTGTYDKLVSLEMIEAVGYHYFDSYFGACSRLLKPEGMMLLQAITIADQRYEAAKRSVDFIQRYIFPGSCIPSITALSGSIARASDLRLFHLEDIGPHYVTTLKAWRDNLYRNRKKILRMGYTEDFFRMWEFYFCYCEGGFTERVISNVQMLLTKPGNRRVPIPCFLGA
ncbi:MAG TPA: cyclopropane-fatty-acyl-phospholipid synthase family protein [Nitrospirales bacterium]|nr:cyclopropane-fatty-acyl-phospholipid synthase family protein [Nitrospirales bacterium]